MAPPARLWLVLRARNRVCSQTLAARCIVVDGGLRGILLAARARLVGRRACARLRTDAANARWERHRELNAGFSRDFPLALADFPGATRMSRRILFPAPTLSERRGGGACETWTVRSHLGGPPAAAQIDAEGAEDAVSCCAARTLQQRPRSPADRDPRLGGPRPVSPPASAVRTALAEICEPRATVASSFRPTS